jgi:hypothetical protein
VAVQSANVHRQRDRLVGPGQSSVAWLRETEYARRQHRESTVPLTVRFNVLAGDERRAGAAFTVDRTRRVVRVGREQVIGLIRR